EAKSAVREDTEWANSADGADPLETFVTTAVTHAVEGAHPRPARLRTIAGVSMGGYGAMNIGLHQPTLYGQIVSVSGYFHIDDPDKVFAGNRKLEAANSP